MQKITKYFEILNDLQCFWDCNPGQKLAKANLLVYKVLDTDLRMHIECWLWKKNAYTG